MCHFIIKKTGTVCWDIPSMVKGANQDPDYRRVGYKDSNNVVHIQSVKKSNLIKLNQYAEDTKVLRETGTITK